MTRVEAIADITRRLVDSFQPERIYLFGSEAWGEGGPDSDLDFPMVVGDDAPLEGLGAAAVVREGRVCMTPEGWLVEEARGWAVRADLTIGVESPNLA